MDNFIKVNLEKVEKVHFLFENLDNADIKPEHIKYLEYNKYGDVKLYIKNTIPRNETTAFGEDAYNRFKSKDIVNIIIVYKDKTTEKIKTNWYEYDETNNLYQIYIKRKDGIKININVIDMYNHRIHEAKKKIKELQDNITWNEKQRDKIVESRNVEK